MQRVLVLEKNQQTADRLITALRQISDISVSLVPTMREACLIVAQAPQDMGLIPFEESEQLSRALRSLQPELALILTTADPHLMLSNKFSQDFQGLLHTSLLEKELPEILSQVNMAAAVISIEPDRDAPPIAPPSLSRLMEACQELGLNERSLIEMVVLAANGHLIGYFGSGSDSQAYAVVELTSESWQNGLVTAQIQFLQLPDHYDARLIYSRRVSGAILSLVAEPEMAVGEVRQTAEKLARLLSDPDHRTAERAAHQLLVNKAGKGTGADPNSSTTFAIAWRPVKPLPGLLQGFVRDCITLQVKEYGCQLSHLSITAIIIHLVIACPAGKTAAWATYQLKSDINSEIQRRFGVKSSIWRKGFYAAESSRPLNEAELKMLLTP
jgi:hypothetical protein